MSETVSTNINNKKEAKLFDLSAFAKEVKASAIETERKYRKRKTEAEINEK